MIFRDLDKSKLHPLDLGIIKVARFIEAISAVTVIVLVVFVVKHF